LKNSVFSGVGSKYAKLGEADIREILKKPLISANSHPKMMARLGFPQVFAHFLEMSISNARVFNQLQFTHALTWSSFSLQPS
jgi:hypothetical protein|tara:strand:- start:11 stop:256 length:246 start_codon:yes stop_codon:yes gene_type:complete